jgi:putative endonuclease
MGPVLSIAVPGGRFVTQPSPTSIGRKAESRAADWLQQSGFTILSRNWRTRWVEIDIVALKDRRIHIIEVKYRRSARYGTGFDSINHDKVRRLRLAATAWLHAHHPGCSYQIDVIAVYGFPEPNRLQYLGNAVEGR